MSGDNPTGTQIRLLNLALFPNWHGFYAASFDAGPTFARAVDAMMFTDVRACGVAVRPAANEA